MIELHKRYTFTMPAGTISDRGIAQIKRLVAIQDLQSAEWQAKNPTDPRRLLPGLPEDWQWLWVVADDSDYQGAFPKRIRRYYFKNFGIKCPDNFIAEIGNLARAHSNEGLTYYFEFVDEFEWDSGDFGDHSSCYWGDRSGARIMLRDNGAWAICFFTMLGIGFARAWVASLHPDLYIVFNGYGFDGNATLTIARVVAAFLKGSYKKIGLRNHGGTTGTLWINDGAGYVIGPVDMVDQTWDHDFGWDDVDGDCCYECGTWLHEDEVLYGPDSEAYCESCFDNLFSRCDHCDEYYAADMVDYDDKRREYLCQYCRDELNKEDEEEEGA